MQQDKKERKWGVGEQSLTSRQKRYFMSIYLIVLLLILMEGGVLYSSSTYGSKRDNLFCVTSFIIIFLLYALSSVNVGRDVLAYEFAYLELNNVDFIDFDYIYFENGYILFEKICFKLGIPFQLFKAICYFFILLPYFVFINKYSQKPLLSLIIYYCYMFTEFQFSGIRQSLAMGIGLCGIMIFLSNTKSSIYFFYLLVSIAFFFHHSAIVLLVIPWVKKIKSSTVFCGVSIIISCIMTIFRHLIFVLIKKLFSRNEINMDSSVYIGTHAIFLILLGLFCLFVINASSLAISSETKVNENDKNRFFMNLFFIGVSVAIFFGSDGTARAYMYFVFGMIALLPNLIKKFPSKIEFGLEVITSLCFIAFFILNTLIQDKLGIVPYEFYWQVR